MSSEIHPKMYMYRRIVEAKLYIDAHYAEKIELDKISDQACFSKYHFLRLFKAAYGRSPHQYLTELRIHHAKDLLAKGQSVSEVCFAVGFESLPSFTRLFKKNTGSSPKLFSQKCTRQDERTRQQPLSRVPACFADNFGWNK